jgi:glycosyltransferase involved in cell wall biosynthesis
MSNKKNISFLIDVYKEYKEKLGDKALPLRLIGEGPNLQEYKEKVINAKIEGVYFLGVKNDSEIGNELSNARALLIPSFYEEWGFVVNEAVALSVPVLVSEHVLAREVLVKQFVNGLIIEPTNYTGWLESLIMISENQELYKKLSTPTEESIKLADIASFKKGIKILIDDNSF